MRDIENIRQKYTPEMALVILVCRVYFKTADSAAIAIFINHNNIDWALVERIITVHQVRPLIYKVLSQYPEGVDKGFLDNLHRLSVIIASGNLYKFKQLAVLHDEFTKGGVRNIPYKGVVLSQFLYGDLITRETADIDFLIETEGFAVAMQVLLRNGYAPVYYYNPAFLRQFLHAESELIFRKEAAGGIVKVELHWAITHRMMNIPLPVNKLFDKAQPIILQGSTINVLSAGDRMLVLLVHHGVNDIWRTLRHILDTGAMLQQQGGAIDWQYLLSALEKYRVRTTAAAGFKLCEEILGIRAPVDIPLNTDIQSVADNLLNFPALGRQKLSLAHIRQQMLLRDSHRDRLRLAGAYLRTALTPNMRDVEAVTLAARWHFMYYFLKPFLLLFRRR